MAQRVLETAKMPELQLRQELRNRFPEISQSVLMKVMKRYDNDAEKCIQALEDESQASMYGSPQDSSPHPPGNHSNNNIFNHGAGTNNTPNRSNNSYGGAGNCGAGAAGGLSSSSMAHTGPTRYQEVPVKHETKHISTVQHTVGPPNLPPKPLPPKSAPTESNPFAHPTMPPVPPRPVLLIDPVNQGDHPHTTPVRPHDFTPFINPISSRADIHNIRCTPTGASTVVPGLGGSASSGSPETRRPVRVINYVNNNSGGTLTSGVISPTNVQSRPQFMVYRGDGGGTMSSFGPSSTAPQDVNPYRFLGQQYFQAQPQQAHWVQQETERPGVHSSSIYIDTASTQMTARRTIQESVGGQDLNTLSASPHLAYRSGGASFLDSQEPASLPPSMPRLPVQPVTVSLSSHATPQGTVDRGQNTVTYSGFMYNPTSYGPGGYSAPTLPSPSGVGAGSDRIVNVMNVVSGGTRYSPLDGTSNVQRSMFPVSFVTQGMGQVTVSPLAVGSTADSSPSPSAVGSGAPPLLPKSPRLQHQRSTGSSTSRSDSMDSEHGSVNSHSHFTHDYSSLPASNPNPFYTSSSMQQPSHRMMGGMQMMGVGMLSPASSQSSLSSESSSAAASRDPRDPNSNRPRSGSLQEEAAYSQALLHHQRLRKEKLKEDMEIKKQQLNQLRQQVSEAEKAKITKNSQKRVSAFAFPSAEDIGRLCESNRLLQTDIQMYLNEIDMFKNGQTPFNVIDPMGQQNFYSNMPTGPNDLFRPHSHTRHNTPPPTPPPRPPPLRAPPPPPQRVNSNDLTTQVPAPAPCQTGGGGSSADSEEGERWSCAACTFENHPALKKCEMCEMPRITGS